MQKLFCLLCYFVSADCLTEMISEKRTAGHRISNLPLPLTTDISAEERSNDDSKSKDIFLRITDSMENQNVSSGQDVMFRCKIAGWPKENIHFIWYHENVKVTTTRHSSRHSISTHDWGSKLKIKSAYTFDSGFYRCEASNGYRRVHDSARLFVSFEQPPPRSDKEKKNMKVPQGRCQLYGGTTCIQYLNQSQIYIDPEIIQEEIEKHAQIALNELTKTNPISETCRQVLLPLFCYYVFPPCRLNDHVAIPQPKRLCKDECYSLKDGVCFRDHLLKRNNDFLKHAFQNIDCDNFPSLDKECVRFHTKREKIKIGTGSECFNDDGSTYNGRINITESGEYCKIWPVHLASKYPDLLGSHQYCRNPGSVDKKPWCYTDQEKLKKARCRIKRCGASYEAMRIVLILSVICLLLFLIGLAVICIYYCRNSKKSLGITPPSSYLLDIDSPLFSAQMKLPQLNASSVHLLSEIGKGNYGKVYSGTISDDHRVPTERIMAVKVLNQTEINLRLDEFNQEFEFFSELEHPNITNLKAAVFHQSFHCLIFEYTEQVDLHECLVLSQNSKKNTFTNQSCNPNFDNFDFADMSLQIASGLQYLSSKNYFHPDVATRNILVCGNMELKVSIVEMIKDAYLTSYYKSSDGKLMPIRWMAPESLQCRKFSEKSTVWSFGVLLWEMYSFGIQPYGDCSDKDILDMITNFKVLRRPSNCPDKMYSLMCQCWERNPLQRITFQEICSKIQLIMEVNDVVLFHREEIEREMREQFTSFPPPPEYSSRPTSTVSIENEHSNHFQPSFTSFASTKTRNITSNESYDDPSQPCSSASNRTKCVSSSTPN